MGAPIPLITDTVCTDNQQVENSLLALLTTLLAVYYRFWQLSPSFSIMRGQQGYTVPRSPPSKLSLWLLLQIRGLATTARDWKLYSLQYTNISTAFFMPHDVGNCCAVIGGHFCTISHASNSFIHGNCCACVPTRTTSHCRSTLTPSHTGRLYQGKTRQTDRHGPIWCSSLTLQREENLK